jgi:hypothetical protein
MNIKDYESCKSCETLKQQLEYANMNNKQLTETLLNLIEPKIIAQPAAELKLASPVAKTFARRKAELENAERTKKDIIANSPFIAKSVDELEKELGIEDNEKAI